MQNPALTVMATSTKLSLVFIAIVVGVTQSVDGSKPFIMTQGAAVLGGSATLTCTDSANTSNSSNQNLTFQWFKGDTLLTEGHDNTLTLNNISRETEGKYSCRVANVVTGEVKASSSKIQVTIKIPPRLHIAEGNVKVYKFPEGKNLSLTCTVTNDPKPPIEASGYSWTVPYTTRGRNETQVFSQKFYVTNRNEKLNNSSPSSGYKLAVLSVTRSYSGRYTCHATNDPNNTLGMPTATASIDVQIQYLDGSVNLSHMTSHPVVAGDNVTLTCKADSVPTANLTWLHQGRILRTVESNEDVYSFPATGCQDSGEYRCRADNEAVNKFVYGGINVTVECPPTPAGNGNLPELTALQGKAGDDLTLSVNASGTPPPTYKWSGPMGVSRERSPSVHLRSLQWDHTGVYTVNVSNKHGFFLQKFDVEVLLEKTASSRSADASDPNLWLTIVGAFLVILVIMCIVAFVLQKRREQKRNRSGRPREIRGEARREGEAPADRQHRRGRPRPRMDSPGRPPNHNHGNHTDQGGHQEPRIRVVARFPWRDTSGGDSESSPFVSPPSDPVDLPPPDPVVPREETGPPGPPFGPLSGIPMHIYPWAILPKAESSDSADELEDKYGLPKSLRFPNHQHHPGTPSEARPQPEGPEPLSTSAGDILTPVDEANSTYGVVDVVRGRRPRPSSLERFDGGAPSSSLLNPAPPKPHFRTLPTWDEVKDEEVVNLDVVPDAPLP